MRLFDAWFLPGVIGIHHTCKALGSDVVQGRKQYMFYHDRPSPIGPCRSCGSLLLFEFQLKLRTGGVALKFCREDFGQF